MSTTTIKLPADHDYLASLPDGTRDELVLRSDGVAVLTERVGKVVRDGSADEGWVAPSDIGGGFYRFTSEAGRLSGGAYTLGVKNRGYCDRFKYLEKYTEQTEHVYCANNRLYLTTAQVDTAATLKTWLAANPVTVIYKLSTPTTRYSADNGTTWSTTDPAAGQSAIPLQKGTNNVWCTDRLSPEVALEYVQDTTAVIKKLSAAIVAAGSIGV